MVCTVTRFHASSNLNLAHHQQRTMHEPNSILLAADCDHAIANHRFFSIVAVDFSFKQVALQSITQGGENWVVSCCWGMELHQFMLKLYLFGNRNKLLKQEIDLDPSV